MEKFDKYSPEWLERFEEIEKRSNDYLANFMESPEYDFDKMDEDVIYAQTRLIEAYEAYASGEMMIARVADFAKLLRDSFKRPVQAPPPAPVAPSRNYARENWEKAQRAKNIPPPEKDYELIYVYNYEERRAAREDMERQKLLHIQMEKHYIFAGKSAPYHSYIEVEARRAFEWKPEIKSHKRTGQARLRASIEKRLRAEIWGNPLPYRISEEGLVTRVKLTPPTPAEDNRTQKEKDEERLGWDKIDTKGKDTDTLKEEAERLRWTRKSHKLK